jgi:hypothetical protein
MEAVDGDRVHFCAGCKKNVYNLSAMTQTQAEGLLRKHEGHLCVRYYKRTDGTILTQNCPVGQAALRMQMIARSKRVALAAAVFTSMVALADMSLVSQRRATVGDSASPSVFQQAPRAIEDDRVVIGEPMVEPPAAEHTAEMGAIRYVPTPKVNVPVSNRETQGGSLIEAPDPEMSHPDSTIFR